MPEQTPATTPPTDNNFYMGLCMAGAVSAGAYTAGVMDYLIEALEEWDKRKKANTPGTPTHNVVIPVIGGASAGGMTGIITAAALQGAIIPIKEPLKDILAERPENPLYHAWVDLIQTDMFPMMLDTKDIKDGGIISLLNSSFIDAVADRSITANANAQPIPSYFDKNFKVFTTLTNLEGFSYNVDFKTGAALNDKYYMAIHNDYACFKINDSSEAEDGWMPLDFKNNKNIDVAKNAAMATGAFPVGLKSRELKRNAAHVNKIVWCEDVTKRYPITTDPCTTLNVDGGVINNEPFEKVRDVLNGITGEDADTEPYQDETKFKSTVLMIDPFPSTKPGSFKSSQKLFDVIGLTFGAMIEQMRAKPAKLADAMSTDHSGQFLIAPSRRRPSLATGIDEEVAGDKAIACGALDGFGGFINKEFRIHDYFLGRHNCNIFLRDYFTISGEALEANPIFKAGYAGIDKELFKARDGKYQIIPIFTPRPADNVLPIPTFSSGTNWPVVQEKSIERFRPMVKDRVQQLLLNATKLKALNKALLWIGAKIVLNRTITNATVNAIKNALNGHQLLPLNEATKKDMEEGN